MIVHTSRAQILKNCLVTTKVLYYFPDNPSLLSPSPFLWQTLDVVPEVPRVREFLEYWKNNIEGRIHSVTIGYRPIAGAGDIRAGGVFQLH